MLFKSPNKPRNNNTIVNSGNNLNVKLKKIDRSTHNKALMYDKFVKKTENNINFKYQTDMFNVNV